MFYAESWLTQDDPGKVNLDDALASIREVHGTYEDVAMAPDDDDVDKDLDETQVRYTDVIARLSGRMRACQIVPHGSVRNYLAFKQSVGKILSGDSNVALLRLQNESLTPNSVEYFMVISQTVLGDAWSALDDRFARPKMVRDAVIKDLGDLPSITKPSDSAAFRKVVNTVMAAKVDLKACGREAALGDSASAQLMNELPSQIRR